MIVKVEVKKAVLLAAQDVCPLLFSLNSRNERVTEFTQFSEAGRKRVMQHSPVCFPCSHVRIGLRSLMCSPFLLAPEKVSSVDAQGAQQKGQFTPNGTRSGRNDPLNRSIKIGAPVLNSAYRFEFFNNPLVRRAKGHFAHYETTSEIVCAPETRQLSFNPVELGLSCFRLSLSPDLFLNSPEGDSGRDQCHEPASYAAGNSEPIRPASLSCKVDCKRDPNRKREERDSDSGAKRHCCDCPNRCPRLHAKIVPRGPIIVERIAV